MSISTYEQSCIDAAEDRVRYYKAKCLDMILLAVNQKPNLCLTKVQVMDLYNKYGKVPGTP